MFIESQEHYVRPMFFGAQNLLFVATRRMDRSPARDYGTTTIFQNFSFCLPTSGSCAVRCPPLEGSSAQLSPEPQRKSLQASDEEEQQIAYDYKTT